MLGIILFSLKPPYWINIEVLVMYIMHESLVKHKHPLGGTLGLWLTQDLNYLNFHRNSDFACNPWKIKKA